MHCTINGKYNNLYDFFLHIFKGTQLNHNDHLNSSFESLPTQTQTSAKFHRELPTDLSEEALEREAG